MLHDRDEKSKRVPTLIYVYRRKPDGSSFGRYVPLRVAMEEIRALDASIVLGFPHESHFIEVIFSGSLRGWFWRPNPTKTWIRFA